MEDSAIIAPSQDEIDRIRGYRDSSRWLDSATKKHFTNYECVECQYSTLYHDKILKHVQEGDHPWAYPGQYAPELTPVEDEDKPVYG